MNKYIIAIFMSAMLGCTDSKITSTVVTIGKCYKYQDEAAKIVGIAENEIFYKHSWNDQEKIFHKNIIWDRTFGTEIDCGPAGYEFLRMQYRFHMMELEIEYLEKTLHKGKN